MVYLTFIIRIMSMMVGCFGAGIHLALNDLSLRFRIIGDGAGKFYPSETGKLYGRMCNINASNEAEKIEFEASLIPCSNSGKA